MLYICYSACSWENRSLEGTILHIQETKASQNTMFRDLILLTEEAMKTDSLQKYLQCGIMWINKTRKLWRLLGGGFCRWAFDSDLKTPRVCLVWSFGAISLSVSVGLTLRKIDMAIILSITYSICVTTDTLSFSSTARSKGQGLNWPLISGSLEMASHWKPFVMGNPFLIELMHLHSLCESWKSGQRAFGIWVCFFYLFISPITIICGEGNL